MLPLLAPLAGSPQLSSASAPAASVAVVFFAAALSASARKTCGPVARCCSGRRDRLREYRGESTGTTLKS